MTCTACHGRPLAGCVSGAHMWGYWGSRNTSFSYCAPALMNTHNICICTNSIGCVAQGCQARLEIRRLQLPARDLWLQLRQQCCRGDSMAAACAALYVAYPLQPPVAWRCIAEHWAGMYARTRDKLHGCCGTWQQHLLLSRWHVLGCMHACTCGTLLLCAALRLDPLNSRHAYMLIPMMPLKVSCTLCYLANSAWILCAT